MQTSAHDVDRDEEHRPAVEQGEDEERSIRRDHPLGHQPVQLIN